MLLQLAIDQPDALAVAREVADVIDIMEVGTPLLKRFGLGAISTVRELAPDTPVLADTKTVDGGALEAEMVFNAGAMFMTALACADLATFDAANTIAQKYGAYVVFDSIAGGADRLDPNAPYSDRGRIVSVHAGFDSRASEQASRNDNHAKLESARARGYDVALAGGIDRENLARYIEAGPDVIVVGRAITAASDPRGAAEWMKSQLPAPGHGWPWEKKSRPS